MGCWTGRKFSRLQITNHFKSLSSVLYVMQRIFSVVVNKYFCIFNIYYVQVVLILQTGNQNNQENNTRCLVGNIIIRVRRSALPGSWV